ncbi:hypothetical protein CN918_28050 [Priestia megaterium]|nr:hypothetical protein CN918_28050 [Priestia megaterium]
MIRRNIVFHDTKERKFYVSAEFNGDKTELERRKSRDWCDKDFSEIVKSFNGVETLEDFKKSVGTAQSFYHSCFGECEWEAIEVYDSLAEINNDEVYVVSQGIVFLKEA